MIIFSWLNFRLNQLLKGSEATMNVAYRDSPVQDIDFLNYGLGSRFLVPDSRLIIPVSKGTLTWNLKPETWNLKPETRNPKPETRFIEVKK